MKSSKSHFIALTLSVIYCLSACSSTGVFNDTAQLTDVTSSWLHANCTDSDWRQSSKLSYRNCNLASSDIKGDSYTCEFSSGRARGLFKDSSSLVLLCGVKAKGVENVGVTYTDGTSNTSAIGAALAATAVAAVAVAAATAVKKSNYTQSTPYVPSYYIRGETASCKCPYDRAVDGSRCGARSSWSRSGGAEPNCSIDLLTLDDILEKQ